MCHVQTLRTRIKQVQLFPSPDGKFSDFAATSGPMKTLQRTPGGAPPETPTADKTRSGVFRKTCTVHTFPFQRALTSIHPSIHPSIRLPVMHGRVYGRCS
ncbi:Hypothetical predicted protein [Xyrichtys novacula]|uniref:Uncharacterized protein n=1 Tax=Xyrichtys novacula TaxID=13765 RepID=A0AAV1G196_XYRNO|nr:Hypothetical predicted protein [Xyrichtys novacula]